LIKHGRTRLGSGQFALIILTFKQFSELYFMPAESAYCIFKTAANVIIGGQKKNKTLAKRVGCNHENKNK
jgi:hypothetical protein